MEETQELNLEQLEEMYGADLAKKIKKNMECAVKYDHKFKIEKVSESKHFVEIAFVSSGYAHIYEVMLEDKTIVFENSISWKACSEINKLMNSFN